MKRLSVVVHGHFYQPPREDPWTGRVPEQPSAAPFHDWNERVHEECYRAVVAAHVHDGGRVARIVNTLEWISWDAGPTLLQWLAREHPRTYQGFLGADVRSRERTGHGNAMASPYHHSILPLASRREKVTEVRWGIADFRRRFGREPEGMWLPETAVDTETLEVLAQEGIHFTILAPRQVESPPEGGLPGRVSLPSGRSIAVFVYDGGLSHDVAFGELLRDSGSWVERMVSAPPEIELLSLATDGETFGHHHRWGEMALAAMISEVATRPGFRVESYASFLARNPPSEEVTLVEPSSWSCAHGVERWRSDCGCKIDPSEPSSQEWRSTLREVLDELGQALHARFTEEGGTLFRDPLAARDEYGATIGAADHVVDDFMRRHGVDPGEAGARRRALQLLEMERDALAMHTSCGWFFDDLAGLEPLQNLRYAAHALDLLGEGAGALEDRLVHGLGQAVSNDPREGDGAELWRRKVRATPPPPPRRREAALDPLDRAVARALAVPSAERVDAALAALEAARAPDLFDVQTAAIEALAHRDVAEPHLARLAEGLGVATEPSEPVLPSGSPMRFVFGIHVHQPVGNFDEVFESHVENVYAPLLERCSQAGFLPLALHVSGPLLEWLERAGHPYLDLVARLVADGSLEMLLSGFYEPVLPALSRQDRLEQIGWMRDWLAERLGADARGLWLTERVWEPGLARDLADAGVEYVFVDDRHFVGAGVDGDELYGPWRTESEGGSLALFPIDERLRYLIPFRSPPEIADYLRRLSSAGRAVAVLADDGEKFGGWPGTAEWVWEGGWLSGFLEEMERLAEAGVMRLAAPSDVLAEVPAAGLAYLPSASYREMEEWSLPPRAAERAERARAVLEAAGEPTVVLRGGHWRNFIARYEESNRMHKKAQLLSELCRASGDPKGARRAIGRAQCNDAYWHGVFGGLYLRHLRGAVWKNLAEAEGILRSGQALAAEARDLDEDGAEEIWVHSDAFSAVVAPHRGGRLVEHLDFASGVNLADVLTRRREAYHRMPTPDGDHEPVLEDGAMPSIHEMEEGLTVDELPAADPDVRALFLDRVLPASLDEETYRAVDYRPMWSWAGERFEIVRLGTGSEVIVELESTGIHRLEKRYRFSPDGSVEVGYRWDPAAFPLDARFAPELSLAARPRIELEPEPLDTWRHDIVTVSKTEAGFEESVQGESLTPLWPSALGRARVILTSTNTDPR